MSAPGMQDPGKPREVCADEPLVFGQPLESRCRRLQQGLVGEAVLRAAEGAQRLRASAGEKAVRPGQLVFHVVGEPRRGVMLLTRRAVPVAAGGMDAGLCATAVALREALAGVSTAAMADGADDRAVHGGEGRRTRQGLWRKGGEEIAERRHGRSPCMRAVLRS